MTIYHEITIIIVSYKSEKLISENLAVLKKFPTIIVDNSNSKNLNSIISEYDNIKLINPKKNLGYGKANNLGVSSSTTPYILIINPDVLLSEELILKLYSSFQNNIKNAGVLGPSLYDANMNRRTNGSISYVKKTKGKKLSNFINNIPVGDTCCEFLVGCCLFLKKDFFNKLGGFDENFFMYFEDNDFCDRVLKNGKTVMEIPAAHIIHLENSSSQKSFFQDTKMALVHKISSYIYLNKNLSNKSFIYYLLINFFDYFQRFIFNFLLFKFKKSFKNFLRLISIFLYLTSIYKILY